MKGHHVFFSSRDSSPPRRHGSPSPLHSPDHRAFSEVVLLEDVDSAESVIARWDLDAHKEKFSPLFAGDREDAKVFLQAVNGLQNAMRVYLKHHSSSGNLVRAQRLMQVAIKRLEKEFHVVLSANRKNLDLESSSSSRSARSGVPDEEESEEGGGTPTKSGSEKSADLAVADLRSIAECMIGCGYGKECVKIYKLIRKSIVDEALHFLGIEKLNHSQMQKMEWNVLDVKIKNWIRGVKSAVKVLFHGEKILCDTVFAASEKLAESCFADISSDAAVSMFSFAENFGRSKKILSPEKIFRALDLYQAISELRPEIDAIFWHESQLPVKTEASAALKKLGEAVKLMLAQLETAIEKDSSKTPPGGGVHPLTRYVMNYLTFLGDYTETFSDIISDWSANQETPLPESFFSSPTAGVGQEDPSSSTITPRLAWLILVLLCKLDGKAKLYDDVALSYLFLANNLNYVISKVRDSNLGLLMGADWILRNRSKVTRYLSKFERMGWTAVISSLPTNLTADIPPDQLKEHFKQFNRNFEEAYKKQSSWVIPDSEVRDRVKISLQKEIVNSYRIFYEKHHHGGGDRGMVRYIPEDLDNYLSDLFFPAASGGGISTGAHSSGHKSPIPSPKR
ncbi:hypothetical protein M569_02816 [Genlisea aurea]|uniref:Exocyst subunit Exo70 family protein n=1 Tax=Genlisea aurea TaxID=192259 RepID=S8D3G6_9LAMI|nr:hypothetical protein M569_02816 [Genlisea aurea]